MQNVAEAIKWLIDAGAHKTPHGTRTLFDHLLGTYLLLREDQASKEVCFAGLFHSVYGTSFFKIETTQDREVIRNLIGEEAEYLVWLFCNLQRPQCWKIQRAETTFYPFKDGTQIAILNTDMELLKQIEDANLREQKPPKY